VNIKNKTWSKKQHKLSVILLFIVTSAFVVYLLPTQAKFKYEYQKGTPWQHEDLIASFDFAIKKTDSELKQEKDSALINAKPYFKYNNNIREQQISLFLKLYNKRYKEAIANANQIYPQRLIPDSIYRFCKKQSVDILNFIYRKGVVDFSEILDNTHNNGTIVILKNNMAQHRSVDEVFTPKIAYSYINKYLNQEYPNNTWLIAVIKNLKLYDFVVQNIFYDAKTSEKVKEKLIASIPTTRGMVQAGQRIVSRGEVINNENFRMLESLKKEYQNLKGSSKQFMWLYIGKSIIVISLFGLLYLFLLSFRKKTLLKFSKSLFIIMMVMIMFIASTLVIKYTTISLYLIPYVALPVILYAFYDSRIAFYIHLITITLVGFIAPNAFEFIFLQFTAGAVAIFSLTQMHRRAQLFISVGLIIFTYIIIYSALSIMAERDISKIDYFSFLWFAGNGLLLLASYPLIFLFEKIFGFLSDATLLELSDTNHPILRLLAEKAPGTFHHVIQVANLAEDAIRVIGGNSLLMRVGALYHDIGKIGAPGFFIENQGGHNPHDGMDYEKSAEIIIQHVHYGGELAAKYKIPKPIVDFIYTHHGSGVVKYFYTKYTNEHNGKIPDISKFSYPGPAPFSKETSVLMMADAVEAASRTIKEYTKESINSLVDKIINAQIEDHQFEEANITFRDIYKIKEVFKEKLLNIYHSRIEYPDKK